jgi:hypothetical protein
VGIHADSGADIFIEIIHALEHDQRAMLASRKPCCGADNRLDGRLDFAILFFRIARDVSASPANSFQATPNLRGKNDRDSE